MTLEKLRSYFHTALGWDALPTRTTYVLASPDPLSVEEIAHAKHIVAVAILSDPLPSSDQRKSMYALLKKQLPLKQLVLIVGADKIIWSFQTEEVETPATLPDPSNHPFLSKLILSIKTPPSYSEIEKQLRVAFKIDQLPSKPIMQIEELIQRSFGQIEQLVKNLRNHAAKLASKAFMKQTTITFEDLVRLQSVLDEFEHKVHILRDDAHTLFTEFPDLLSEFASIALPPSVPSKAAKPSMVSQMHQATPQRRFRCPILRALIEMGGSAQCNRVLVRVGQLMKHLFTPADYVLVHPNEPKRQNTARWERNKMKNEGLLAANSPIGIWEITEAGRRYYENHCRDSQ